MAVDLIAYAVTVVFVPAIGAGQAPCAWWTDPMRVFYRRMWLAEHWPPHRHQVHRFPVARAEAWTQSEAAENTHSQPRILIPGPLVACVEVTFPQLPGEALLFPPT
ncbi:hypothetical protein LWC34_30420 [Kibdelosporangium philippinense]|uniref:Secreted protein n=1 Tax=Kibdelosporangium philippinense TaxID=211113 RepID=A0ABS8ZMS4_9PSEU|nr:hypothetical protein [Kibdelosporangium philippinense]MCE7007107.1 hypothetical protein [Kibdelosporangium philippinense]MCE7007110.1 hypothetical protein [Kibdelosporangium philippinense]